MRRLSLQSLTTGAHHSEAVMSETLPIRPVPRLARPALKSPRQGPRTPQTPFPNVPYVPNVLYSGSSDEPGLARPTGFSGGVKSMKLRSRKASKIIFVISLQN